MDMRLLIVDDHPAIRAMLKFVYEAAAIHSVEEASTCAGAVGAVREKPLDVVLLDMVLPDGNGLDALREMF